MYATTAGQKVWEKPGSRSLSIAFILSRTLQHRRCILDHVAFSKDTILNSPWFHVVGKGTAPILCVLDLTVCASRLPPGGSRGRKMQAY